MLEMPENASPLITVVGIDPGSETLGYAELKYDSRTKEIVSTFACTFIGSKLCKNLLTLRYEEHRHLRIKAHSENLLKMFNAAEPDYVVAESSFINVKRPVAYGVLMEVMAGIRHAMSQYDPYAYFGTIDPSSIKNAVGVKGGSKDKDLIKHALMKIPELNYKGDIPIANLDEHSCDALAAVYAKFKLLTGTFEHAKKSSKVVKRSK